LADGEAALAFVSEDGKNRVTLQGDMSTIGVLNGESGEFED
jgi:hypothetical protein